ncbi:UxaA family hydrolase [Stakelama saccharophila]|uniref:UxaA family hydrolase n=2 Tax=Stakelama saccharophila TaxID=3075605 RepID=A0ABZ0B5Y6_9SPHN|nr:UxaA family hydrolase [Stakelama sp. W311]WNO52420.1 UxaA family hydrolase [Stakelama sp. W311]
MASSDIAPGEHVHSHNLAMADMRSDAAPSAPAAEPSAMRYFDGYVRPDGRVGTRNYVAVLSSVNCSATVARQIAEAVERQGLLDNHPGVDGIVPIVHGTGCGMAHEGEAYELLRRTLWGTAANPNFGAILLVGLGCEVIQTGQLIADYAADARERIETFTIQQMGGTRKAIEEGVARVKTLLPEVAAAKRERVPASRLVLGLQCGGSDAWSGVTVNPALGNAVDRLVGLGATVLLSETPEIYGAEHLLYARATPEVAAKLRARLDWWEDYTSARGAEMDNNPSPGNKAGGLTTILEKSLGAVAKAGTAPLADVICYGEPVPTSGLVFMDSPGFDPCSATGQVASGATLIAFTTGRGSAFGYKPSPSIKLSSNTQLYEHMPEDIDLDCGAILTGNASIEEKGKEILDYLLATASGQRSKSEALGYGGMEFVPWQIGAVM